MRALHTAPQTKQTALCGFIFPCEERADYDYEWNQGFVFSVKEGHSPSLDDSGQLVHSRVVYLERAYLAGCHRRVSKRQRSDYSR